jgi:hypothetical protein
MLIVKDFFNNFMHDSAKPFMWGEFPGVYCNSIPFNQFKFVRKDLDKIGHSIAFLKDTNRDTDSKSIDLRGPRLEINNKSRPMWK